MSLLKKPVDFKALENELEEALNADKLYKLQNEAKIRAIQQKVPTYDDFRNMVLTAHLRPLDRFELKKKTNVSWNQVYTTNTDDNNIDQINNDLSLINLLSYEDDDDDLKKKTNEFQNETEFLKALNQLTDNKEKLKLLIDCSKYYKEKFFKVEIPTDFLSQVLKICKDADYNEDSSLLSKVLVLLKILTECNRFSLNLSMLMIDEKSFDFKSLFDKLLTLARDRNTMSEINHLILNYCIVVRDSKKI